MFKILVVGALLISALVSASSASATSWSTNGSITYTATAPAAKLEIHSPSTPLTICTTVQSAGHLVSGVGATGSTFDTGTVTPIFGSCTIAGLVATVNCSSNAHLVATGESPANVINGHLTNISCTITRGVCVITVTGEVTTQYNDTTGQLTVAAAGQSLLANAPGNCNSITGFTAAGGGLAASTFGTNATPITDLTYTVTSSPKPVIHHTP
jgi:predicted DNA-binding protein with PD1-like motif